MRVPSLFLRWGTSIVLLMLLLSGTYWLLSRRSDDGVSTSVPLVKIDTREVVAGTLPPEAADPQGLASGQALRVAVAAMISPEKTRSCYEALLQAIGKKMGRQVDIVQKKTYAEVNEMVEGKKLDFAFVCSGPYTQGKRKFGMEILVVPVCHGRKVYYSYIIASKASPAASLDDLRGKAFAFTDPNSNTGCLVPRYMLSLKGMTAEAFFKETSFTYSHDNSIKAVAEGVVDGAAVDSLIWEYIDATDPSWTSRTKIIEKSPPFGIPPIVVHPAINQVLKGELRNVLLDLHKTPEGAALLGKIGVDRFEEGEDASYDSIRTMQDWLDKQDGKSPIAENRGRP